MAAKKTVHKGKISVAAKKLQSPKTPPKAKSAAGKALQKHQKKAH